MIARLMPLRPWVPSTTTLAGSVSARRQISWPASPIDDHRLGIVEAESGDGLVEVRLRGEALRLDQIVLLVVGHHTAGESGAGDEGGVDG